MTSSDFRQKARDALSGKWLVAILAGFIASILGGIGNSGGSINIELPSDEMTDAELQAALSSLGITEEMLIAFISGFAVFAVIGLIYGIICLIVGSGVSVGYSEFNLALVDGISPGINTLFSRFDMWKTALVARILVGIRVFLWMLLFIIPGIIASYDYAMVSYVLADKPYLSASQALAESKRIMRGNRWRFFCLEFSFIGWAFLSIFTLGLGSLWLIPYTQAATAAFYREISRA